jgi:hypothetical protein
MLGQVFLFGDGRYVFKSLARTHQSWKKKRAVTSNEVKWIWFRASRLYRLWTILAAPAFVDRSCVPVRGKAGFAEFLAARFRSVWLALLTGARRSRVARRGSDHTFPLRGFCLEMGFARKELPAGVQRYAPPNSGRRARAEHASARELA